MPLADIYEQEKEEQRGRYRQSLRRFGERQETLFEQFGKSLEQLQEAAGYYQPGGEFTTSQYGQIEQGTRQGLAQARSQAVRSGMASGTNLSGMLTSALQREGVLKASLESQRIANLTNILTGGAQMQAQLGQITAAMPEPSYQEAYSPAFGQYLGTYGQLEATAIGQATQLEQQRKQAGLARELAEMKIASQEKIAGQEQRTRLMSAVL